LKTKLTAKFLRQIRDKFAPSLLSRIKRKAAITLSSVQTFQFTQLQLASDLQLCAVTEHYFW